MSTSRRRVTESQTIAEPRESGDVLAEEQLQYGGVGRRAVGVIIDGLLLVVAFFVLGYLIAVTTGGATSTGFALEGGPALLSMGLSLAIGFGYFILLEGLYGQTLGKKALGLEVLTEDGAPCDLSASTVRNVLRIVDGLFFYLVGALFVVTSKRKQRLGDRIANTVIVKRS